MPKIVLPHIIGQRLQDAGNNLIHSGAVPVLCIGVDRDNAILVVSMDSELPRDVILKMFRAIVKQMEESDTTPQVSKLIKI